MSGLLSPLKINGLNLKNRLVMPPMARGLCTSEGKPTKELIKHYKMRAKGLGLLIVEHSYVSQNGKLSKGQLGIHKDGLIPTLKRIADAIHSKDTPAVIQINHAGGTAKEEIIGTQPVAPSVAYFTDETAPRKLEREEINNVIKKFGEAARRAKEAGFDAVEIHGAHGFLLNQFLSPLTNKRNDKYGGSLEDRMRFPLAVVRTVKEKLGDFPLLYRLGAHDRKSGGLEPKESKIFAQKLEAIGVDILDISGGLCGSRPSDLKGKQGYFIPLAEELGEVVGVPVIGVGGITDPKFADKVVRGNRVDLVAVGRAILRDPDWPLKAKKVLKNSIGGTR